MNRPIAFLSCLLIAACAQSPARVEPAAAATAVAPTSGYTISNPGGMPADDLAILQAQLGARLASASEKPHVRVTVNTYRMRQGSERAMVGMVPGTDHIRSQVDVLGADGLVLRRTHVMSKNQTAIGSAEALLRRHADEIANFALGTAAN